LLRNPLLCGLLGKLLAAPSDRLRALLQIGPESLFNLQSSYPQGANLLEIANYEHYDTTSLRDCAAHVVANEGIWGFWRGNHVSLLRYVPSRLLFFMHQQWFEPFFTPGTEDTHLQKTIMKMTASSLADMVTLLYVYPLELVHTLLLTDVMRINGQRQFDGLLDVVAKTIAKDGFTGLYRGYGISCLAMLTFRMFSCLAIDVYDRWLRKREVGKGKRKRSVSAKALTTICGIAISIWIYPLDTIRRRMILRSLNLVDPHRSFLQTGMQVMTQEGLLALFAGYPMYLMSIFVIPATISEVVDWIHRIQ